MIIQINMSNLRRQLALMANLIQTVLQYRTDPTEALKEHLASIKKRIRRMAYTSNFDQNILQELPIKQNYQIKNKILNFEKSKRANKKKQMFIQLHIKNIEKCSCQIFNSQLWQFGISDVMESEQQNIKKSNKGIMQLIQNILKYLYCFTLQPLNKQQKNKYMIDYKIFIYDSESKIGIRNFENMSSMEVLYFNQNQVATPIRRIKTKYYFNSSKIQQCLKQVIVYKSLSLSGDSKKNSIDTVDTMRRVSLYQFYDDELDITVLSGSGSDFEEENGQEIELDIQNYVEQDQFQILIQQTISADQRFLNDNFQLFKEFNSQINDYF